MLAITNVPAYSEVGLVAATIGVTRGDDKEEWDSDSSASFHMPHTRVGITAYKKAPAGTAVDAADGTFLLVDGFGTVEMDLDQPDTTAKPMKMVAVVYVPGHSRNLLSTRKTVEQRGKPLVYDTTNAMLGFPGEEALVFNFCPRKGLFSATGVRRTPGEGAALVLAAKTTEAMIIERTGQWGPRADVRRRSSQGAALALAEKMAEIMRTATDHGGPCAAVIRGPSQGGALAVAMKVRDTVKIHRMLAHPCEEITQKMAQAM